MPKVITSPVKRFPGTVTLSDPLTFPQVIAFQDALGAVGELEKTTWARLRYALLPGIISCVEKWELEGVSEHPNIDTFPCTPLVSAGKLVDWLQEEVTALLVEAETVPNE
jgi:hypothetical protein